ncbi:membrane protein [Acetobacter orientalis]|uniref:Membrane protein n=1 Tax=Acetobacter orientalis TaxID=146474 RepID=A0A2Z5ZD98_9PROT|nr:membrane protein [Acetobacter orientalis]
MPLNTVPHQARTHSKYVLACVRVVRGCRYSLRNCCANVATLYRAGAREGGANSS